MSSPGDASRALGAQQVLEQDLQRERQARDVVLRLEGVEAEDLEVTAADAKGGAGVEGVVGHGVVSSWSEVLPPLSHAASRIEVRRAPALQFRGVPADFRGSLPPLHKRNLP